MPRLSNTQRARKIRRRRNHAWEKKQRRLARVLRKRGLTLELDVKKRERYVKEEV